MTKNKNWETTLGNLYIGGNIMDRRGQNILELNSNISEKWAYLNSTNGSVGLPTDEIWGFSLPLNFQSLWIVIFISGTSGKLYFASYSPNSSWSNWYTIQG